MRSVLHRLDYEGKDPDQIGQVDSKIAMNAADFLAHQEGA